MGTADWVSGDLRWKAGSVASWCCGPGKAPGLSEPLLPQQHRETKARGSLLDSTVGSHGVRWEDTGWTSTFCAGRLRVGVGVSVKGAEERQTRTWEPGRSDSLSLVSSSPPWASFCTFWSQMIWKWPRLGIGHLILNPRQTKPGSPFLGHFSALCLPHQVSICPQGKRWLDLGLGQAPLSQLAPPSVSHPRRLASGCPGVEASGRLESPIVPGSFCTVSKDLVFARLGQAFLSASDTIQTKV